LLAAAGAAALVQTGFVALLGDRVLSRIDPWLATVLVLIPVAVASSLPWTPDVVSLGLLLWLGASMVVQAITGYGGCEVVAVPMLALRRRDTIYCGLNPVDAVERSARRRSRWLAVALSLLTYVLLAAALVGGQVVTAPSPIPIFWLAYVGAMVAGYAVSRARRVTPPTGAAPEAGSRPTQ
jgi:hypothetical protein